MVGLAIARELARAGHETLILEAEPHFGSSTSSRNSEVIHAGIYYPTPSLKASLCVRGKDLLYSFCAERGVPHRRLGKLIFAGDPGQTLELDSIMTQAAAAGVDDLERLSRTGARALEPALDCVEALWSPSTGIVDSHALMLALLGDAETHGASLVCNTRVDRIDRRPATWRVHIADQDFSVDAAIVVNSGGLDAQRIASRTDSLPPGHVPPLYLAKGNYFTVSGRPPFSHLIYPVPEPGGLGTHLTLDMGGQARFGPDVEWIDAPDYAVDPDRLERFYQAARRIWPDLERDRLQPGYAGIRPKLSGPGQPAADFLVSGPSDHGLDGLVNLFGIESPGLTASLAIAEQVASMLSATPQRACA